MEKRYALRSKADTEAGTVWSTGSYWSARTPAEADLMTGPEVEAFAARHPQAEIIDVIVYRAAAAVWMKAFRAEIDALGGRPSTHEEREAARAAGNAAVRAAGYTLS